METIAVDWSGRVQGQRQTIWLAHVRDGELVTLANGRSRAELVDHVIALALQNPQLVVGLDFAFSLPAWFLDERGLISAYELWALLLAEGEVWLRTCETPFWGKPGRKRPDLREHFRRTERALPAVAGIRAKSVFQVGGAGAVGTGSIRGMPFLKHLHDSGFSIWPFDQPGWPRVVEIYPRLLTGPVVKSSPAGRARHLEHTCRQLGPDVARLAASSEDAFDAAVSALIMSEHTDQLEALGQATDPLDLLEGLVWCPAEAGVDPAPRPHTPC